MQRSRLGGFTLVELLTVIGIIAVLVAILYPVFSSARIKARQTKCISNLHQIVTALKQYGMDYCGYPPWPGYDSATGRFTGGVSALYPDYISDVSIFICPEDTRAIQRQKEAKESVYSSYNADIDFVMFLANPSGYIETQTVNIGGVDVTNTYLVKRLYNYFGYVGGGNDAGYDTYLWADPLVNPGEPRRPCGPEFGDPLPIWLSDKGLQWRHYPRLMNRYAPDNTIVVHCPHHRKHYSKTERTRMKEVVIRLGGEAGVTELSNLDATITNSDGSQTPGWVHQRY